MRPAGWLIVLVIAAAAVFLLMVHEEALANTMAFSLSYW
jgi:hypothetical protein